MWHRPCNKQIALEQCKKTTLVDIQKRAKIHSFIIAYNKSAVSLLESREQCYIVISIFIKLSTITRVKQFEPTKNKYTHIHTHTIFFL